MYNIFQMRDILRYNLRSETKFLRVLSSKAWNMVPTEIKNSATLNIFKEKIRKGGGGGNKNCNCKYCLPHIQNIGFINII